MGEGGEVKPLGLGREGCRPLASTLGIEPARVLHSRGVAGRGQGWGAGAPCRGTGLAAVATVDWDPPKILRFSFGYPSVILR